MTPEQRERMWILFDQAFALGAKERAAFLDGACGDDAGLRAELESLLAHANDEKTLLESPLVRPSWGPTLAPATDGPAAGHAPRRVGNYRLLRLLGVGGMGTVYEAEQENPRRTVALKVIRPGLASPGVVKRFSHEAHILGRLQHPGIAQVHEAGVTEDGRPFFAMELIRGQPLDEYANLHSLTVAARLDLLARVCDAVQHAHDKSVIHRDLKPANILVDESGQPKVLDFGVARVTAADLDITAGRTVEGQLVGTPSYMSPEQVSADPASLDARSDVYALGVVLFELLAHRLPYPLQNLPLHEVARVIREQEPSSLGLIDARLRGDVETIVAKALAKDRARRYPSAGALAADVRRHLGGQPVVARPISAAERLARWVRHNRSLAALLAVLVVAAAGSTVAAVRFKRLADENEQATAAERWERYRADIAAAGGALELHNVGTARAALDDAPRGYRGWEWRHFAAQLDGARLVLRGPEGGLGGLAVSPDGTRVASAGAKDHIIYLWDAATGKKVSRLAGHTAEVGLLAFSPDGRRLASGDEGGTVRLWDVAAAAQTAELAAGGGPVRRLAFSPAGGRLAVVGNRDGAARLWDPATGREVAVLRGATGDESALAFSDDGTRLATADVELIRLWDGRTGRPLGELRGHTRPVTSLAFSPDGTRLVSGAHYPDFRPRLWDLATGKASVLDGHKNTVHAVAFSPDGTRIATASQDQTAVLWDAATRRPVAVLRGHTAKVGVVRFTPDGAHVVSGSEDHTLRLWDARGGELLAVMQGHDAPVGQVGLDAAGGLLASDSADGTVRLWDVEALARNRVLRGHDDFVYDVAFSPDGEHAASASWDGTVRVWEVTTGRKSPPLVHSSDREERPVLSVSFSPDGKRLASVARERRVRVWDVASGECRRVLSPLPTGWLASGPRVGFLPDGSGLAVGTSDGRVRVWGREGDEPVAEFTASEKGIMDVAFSPDGARLATCGNDPQVRLWEAGTWAPVATLAGHRDVVFQVVYSSDGRLLASCSEDGTVRLWDARTGAPAATLAHGGPVYAVSFSPDGTRLAAACRDNTIRLWDVGRRAEVAVLRGHTSYVHAVAFSPDGTRLVSGSGDYTLRVWDTLSPQERAARENRE